MPKTFAVISFTCPVQLKVLSIRKPRLMTVSEKATGSPQKEMFSIGVVFSLEKIMACVFLGFGKSALAFAQFSMVTRSSLMVAISLSMLLVGPEI